MYIYVYVCIRTYRTEIIYVLIHDLLEQLLTFSEQELYTIGARNHM